MIYSFNNGLLSIECWYTVKSCQYYCLFGLYPSFIILKQKLWSRTWQNRHLHLKTTSSQNSGSVLEYWVIDHIQRNSNTKCNVPLLKPFRITVNSWHSFLLKHKTRFHYATKLFNKGILTPARSYNLMASSNIPFLSESMATCPIISFVSAWKREILLIKLFLWILS